MGPISTLPFLPLFLAMFVARLAGRSRLVAVFLKAAVIACVMVRFAMTVIIPLALVRATMAGRATMIFAKSC